MRVRVTDMRVCNLWGGSGEPDGGGNRVRSETERPTWSFPSLLLCDPVISTSRECPPWTQLKCSLCESSPTVFASSQSKGTHRGETLLR